MVVRCWRGRSVAVARQRSRQWWLSPLPAVHCCRQTVPCCAVDRAASTTHRRTVTQLSSGRPTLSTPSDRRCPRPSARPGAPPLRSSGNAQAGAGRMPRRRFCGVHADARASTSLSRCDANQCSASTSGRRSACEDGSQWELRENPHSPVSALRRERDFSSRTQFGRATAWPVACRPTISGQLAVGVESLTIDYSVPHQWSQPHASR